MNISRFLIMTILIFGIVSGSGLAEGPRHGRGSGQFVEFVKGRPKLGSLAPGFRLIDLEGKWQSLSDYRGKVVLLNFWATWCLPCRVEMPSMETMYHDLREKGFEILAISSDPQGSIVTRSFVESNALTFPILHDLDYRVSGSYGIRTLPMSFLVDHKGNFRHRMFGTRDWDSKEMRSLIEELLKAL